MTARDGLAPGDRVLLRFARDGADGATVEESLWTRVAGDLCGTAFAGHVIEPASRLTEVTQDTLVVFDAGHVLAVEHRREQPTGAPRGDTMGVVSPRVAATGHATRAWRVEPRPDSNDSGWRFGTDGESLADFANRGSITIRRLDQLLARDPGLGQLLDAPPGTRFERFHPGEPWTRLEASTHSARHAN